ncbi:MAG: hypothetical protein WKF65_18055 [Gaiellaceae bacterium]
MIDVRWLALVGLIASVTIGAAMALRARAAIRSAENAYSRLDRALADTERGATNLPTPMRIWPGRTRRSRRPYTGAGLADLLKEEMERERQR